MLARSEHGDSGSQGKTNTTFVSQGFDRADSGVVGSSDAVFAGVDGGDLFWVDCKADGGGGVFHG